MEQCPVCSEIVTARICRADGRVVAAPPRPPIVPVTDAGPLRFFKPVIYLYPPEPMDVSVSVTLAGGGGDAGAGRFTSLIPSPNVDPREAGAGRVGRTASWRARAQPDGTLEVPAPNAEWRQLLLSSSSGGGGIDKKKPPSAAATTAEGKAAAAHSSSSPPPPAAAVTVSSLFWESEAPPGVGAALWGPAAASEVFCVPGAGAGDWLLRALPRLGLAPREYTDMATFWGMRLQARAAPARGRSLLSRVILFCVTKCFSVLPVLPPSLRRALERSDRRLTSDPSPPLPGGRSSSPRSTPSPSSASPRQRRSTPTSQPWRSPRSPTP